MILSFDTIKDTIIYLNRKEFLEVLPRGQEESLKT